VPIIESRAAGTIAMTRYVLVHGAWHGGWCWERLREQLAQGGADIHAPTLTGLGDRAHLLSPAVSLQTHIDDIVQVLEEGDLRDAVLVGHSYAGMVVTGVAARLPNRLSRLVYLDAVVPRDGQSLFDCSGPRFRSWIDEQVNARGEGWRIPPAPPEFLGLADSADLAWVMPKLVPHPYRTFREPVHLQPGWESRVPRTYVNCIGSRPRGGERSAQAAGIDDYHELPTGHDAMVTAPRELAELLRNLS
jgi:pimeloyl-ACP methyl ester carboxylesterase